MALQLTVKLPEVQELRLLDEAGLCPGSIQDGSSVALESNGAKRKVNAHIHI